MLKILIPVDGSDISPRAVDYVIKLATKLKESDIHLITVRDAMDSMQVHRFWTASQIHDFQQESGHTILAPARKRFEDAGIACSTNIAVGEIARSIADYANEQHCDMIVMGTRGMGSIGNLVMGSVATKVVHLAAMPVTLVK